MYRPAGPDQPPAVVVYLHGGPEAQHTPTFDPLVQYLVAAGRGSDVPGDEGHGLARLVNRLDAYPKVLAFLNDVLASGARSRR